MRHSVDEGMTPADFLNAWTVADTVEAALEQIQTDPVDGARIYDRR
jgi:predicted RNA-binding protein associated with RNAse of E/G family